MPTELTRAKDVINELEFIYRDLLSIHANNGVVYEFYEGKKDAEITEEKCQKLEIAIGEYVHKQ